MNTTGIRPMHLLTVIAAGLWTAAAVAETLPVVRGEEIVASVNGEPITLAELRAEVTSLQQVTAPGEKVDRQLELQVLNRMVTTRLIAQEARRMGLEQLPEVKKLIESFSRESLRDVLMERMTKDVKADEIQVDRIYKDSIREWKISAALCEREGEAKRLEAELKTGRDFTDLAREFLARGRAKKVEDGVYVKPRDVDPDIARVVAALAPGSVSPIIATKSGFVILRLEEIRYRENLEEKAKAEHIVLTQARREKLKAYDESLKQKYVKINREVLNSIDYESPTPGFEALLQDNRVVAEIQGEKPLTVGEMTDRLRYRFYHGLARAVERGRLNPRKREILEALLSEKVFRKEALRLGVDKTDTYRRRVRGYETRVLFGAFINKVIVPDIQLREEEAKAYYTEHLKEYATPEMMRVRSLVFATRGDAERAIERLREGTEFQWLATHAEGQLDRGTRGVLIFDGTPVITADLPEGVRKALGGARAGDSRLYASDGGHFYVLVVQDVAASNPQPYEQAREGIARRLFEEKQRKAVEEYASKLKSLLEVKVYLKG